MKNTTLKYGKFLSYVFIFYKKMKKMLI